MKLKFDANQDYQLDAINSVVNLFEGQPLNKGDFEIELEQSKDKLQIEGEFVIGNNLQISENMIINNLHNIQESNKLKKSVVKSKGGWDNQKWDDSKWDQKILEILENGLNFSVEMETGTGKTYVYLRTIHELNKKYGFKKFIIVVPSLAIKEGVLKNLEITRDHFKSLYDNVEMDFFTYDPRKRGQAKNFAVNNSLQIMIINIDSFAVSKSKLTKRIIYQESDWGKPIEYIKKVKPILIIDEPQNMESDIRKEAINELSPLFTLRYSATHKNLYNLIYKLDPVKAYDLNLVKKIEVDSIISEDSFNNVYIELVETKSNGNKVWAKLKLDVLQRDGVKQKSVNVSVGDKLDNTTSREIYADFIVDEISNSEEYVKFANGKILYVGQSFGGSSDEIVKYQIRKTITDHLEKEKELLGKGIKVLSLFFIDKVANYREYLYGNAQKGKFAIWFEEIFNEIIQNPKYQNIIKYEVSKIHNGYFSIDKKGILKDTKGESQADDDTYTLIMKDKEKLLSIENPLRFIFSHSALREGWDNPNVFQICTLNETKSEMKKRQEIGRGLRIPVNQNGERVFDNSLNILTVIANESYEDFAKTLQTEMQEEGVEFKSDMIKNKHQRRKIKLTKKLEDLDENFQLLWDKIKHKTRYQVNYDTNKLIQKASEAIKDIVISKPNILIKKAKINITQTGVEGQTINSDIKSGKSDFTQVPDVINIIQSKTKLTKNTLYEIINKADKINDIVINPQQFIDLVTPQISRVLNKMMIDGIKYEKIAGEYWNMKEFENDELYGYLKDMYKVEKKEKTLYEYINTDSDVENDFVRDLEAREDVKFYCKLPSWFKIQTPIGSYNPDWAIVFEKDKKIYFVAETKGTNDIFKLSLPEQMKIKCGFKHFNEIEDVEFKAPVTKVEEVK